MDSKKTKTVPEPLMTLPYEALTFVEEEKRMRKLYKYSDGRWLDDAGNEWKLEQKWWLRKEEGQWLKISKKEYDVKIIK